MQSKNKTIATTARTREILNTYNLRAKKNFGQNFLVDASVTGRMASTLRDDSVVIEVGPGIGSLTEELAKRAKHVRSYEIDERLVRGLDYYTHTVFEVVSTRPDSGAQATVFAGGRYDHFVEYYGGPEMSGIGFAIGMERLIALASEEGHVFSENNALDVYVIGLGDVSKNVLVVEQMLRKAGFTTEGNLVKRSLKAQFKSVDRNKAKYVVILGEDEISKNTVNVKRSGDKEQLTVSVDDLVTTLKEWEGRER